MFSARAALVLTLLLQAGVGLGAQPASRKRILLDEAHHNLYASAASGYRSFVALATEDGFAVAPNRSPFTLAALGATDILLIANPNGAGASASIEERARSAFADAEVDAIQQWVERGGALLLVTDHYPTGAAGGALVGRSQAIALEVGRGRVVVVGEMGVLIDYSVREADNRRFALNIVRWLAREL